MRASSSCYKEVAYNCSEFVPRTNESYQNCEGKCDKVSCQNCKHFDEADFCRIDLFDKIVDRNDIDLFQ